MSDYYRIIFTHGPSGGTHRVTIDVNAEEHRNDNNEEVHSADLAEKMAREQLPLEVDDIDWEDWHWIATGKLERCYTCGRQHEVALIHVCPKD